MGKRAELFEELEALPPGDPRAKDIRKKINEIELWMIGKGFLNRKTRWGDDSLPKGYPWHTACVFYEDIRMCGDLNNKGIDLSFSCHHNSSYLSKNQDCGDMKKDPDKGKIHVCKYCN